MILQCVGHLVQLPGDFLRRIGERSRLIGEVNLDFRGARVNQIGDVGEFLGLAPQCLAHGIGLAGGALDVLAHIADVTLQVLGAGANHRDRFLGGAAEPFDPLVEGVRRLIGSRHRLDRHCTQMLGTRLQRVR